MDCLISGMHVRQSVRKERDKVALFAYEIHLFREGLVGSTSNSSSSSSSSHHLHSGSR